MAALYGALGLLSLWAVLSLWFHRGWPGWLCGLTALGWVALAAWGTIRLPAMQGATLVSAEILLALLLFFSVRPSNDRDWTPDQARMPRAEIQGDRARLSNVRFMTGPDKEHCEVRWEERSYDLGKIRTVDFVVSAFSSFRGVAHTFLTFGFEGGEHVAISAEIRKTRGQVYSPLKGLFRNYEVMYVVGDERDLIGLRVSVRKEPVYLYPTKAKPEGARSLFVSMLERANGLCLRPEFYNTVTDTCATNIVHHMEHLTGRSLGLRYEILFPGYTPELAYRRGLIDTSEGFEQTRARCLINGRAALCEDGIAWSEQIRQGLGP